MIKCKFCDGMYKTERWFMCHLVNKHAGKIIRNLPQKVSYYGVLK